MKKYLHISIFSLLSALLFCSCGQESRETPDTTPRLLSIVPYSFVSGGTAIISGYWFSESAAENEVLVDGLQATVTDASTNRLTIILPEHENGEVEVHVSVRGVQSPDVLHFTYTTLPPSVKPAIASITPQSGNVGTEVTITGENFSTVTAENTVRFGSAEATVKTASANTLTVTAPNHNPGTVTVSVTVGGKTAGVPDGFTYEDNANVAISSISPVSGKVGDTVRITGEGFIADPSGNSVKMGVAAAEIVAATATYIDVIVPDQPGGTYKFKVTVGTHSDFSPDFTLARSWRIETIAGTGQAGTVDGVGTSAKVGYVQGAALAPDGLVWFTQRGTPFCIRSFNPSTKEIKTIAKATDTGLGFISYPWGCAFAPNGDFWFCNKGSGTAALSSIGRISGETVSQVSGLDASVQETKNAMCVQFDADGTAYILCRAANNTASSKIYIWDGTQVNGSYDVPGMVECMVLDPAGTHLMLAGNGTGENSSLRTLRLSDGLVSEPFAGTGIRPTDAASYTDGEPGNPLTATIGLVEGMCFTSDGSLWLSDTSAGTFRRLTPGEGGDLSKGTMETVIGTPFAAVHADGLGAKAGIRYPAMPVVISDDSIILPDGTNGYRIRRVYLQ